MENQGRNYGPTNSGQDTHKSISNPNNEVVNSCSNSASNNSYILDNQGSKQNSPISHLDSNTSRLERRKKKTIDRINNFSSDPSHSHVFSEERKGGLADINEEPHPKDTAIQSLRRSKSKRLRDISKDN